MRFSNSQNMQEQNFNYSVRSLGKLTHCTAIEVCSIAHKHRSTKPYAFSNTNTPNFYRIKYSFVGQALPLGYVFTDSMADELGRPRLLSLELLFSVT